MIQSRLWVSIAIMLCLYSVPVLSTELQSLSRLNLGASMQAIGKVHIMGSSFSYDVVIANDRQCQHLPFIHFFFKLWLRQSQENNYRCFSPYSSVILSQSSLYHTIFSSNYNYNLLARLSILFSVCKCVDNAWEGDMCPSFILCLSSTINE